MSARRVAITGTGGQLGFHCLMRLSRHHGYDVTAIDRKSFSDPSALAAALADADVVLHLAGVNRGNANEVAAGNPAIARQLAEALGKSGGGKHVIYASSIQVDRDNVYGRSKREAGNVLANCCAAGGNGYTSLVLLNLFGEFSRPNYNNFTGTFCNQLVNGKALTVNDPAAPVELMHYGEVADLVARSIAGRTTGEIRPAGTRTTVGEVAARLSGFHATYGTGIIPDVRDPFDLRLFNMLRTAMFDGMFPFALKRHADARGAFFECVRAVSSGQTSFSTTVPGVTRGDHFHFDKVERFLVLSGTARISVRRLTDDRTWHFDVSGDEPVFIDMPTMHTHNITNTGDSELLTLFWSHDFFDPERPDTYAEAV